jgi:hypothetical protein
MIYKDVVLIKDLLRESYQVIKSVRDLFNYRSLLGKCLRSLRSERDHAVSQGSQLVFHVQPFTFKSGDAIDELRFLIL